MNLLQCKGQKFFSTLPRTENTSIEACKAFLPAATPCFGSRILRFCTEKCSERGIES